MSHLKIVEIAQLDVPQLHILDRRRRRAAAQPLDQLLDRRLLPLNVGIDAAIRAVADPAGDSERDRLVTHPGAEEHALHLAGHADVIRSPCSPNAHVSLPTGPQTKVCRNDLH